MEALLETSAGMSEKRIESIIVVLRWILKKLIVRME
jgi:hypothetical protein